MGDTVATFLGCQDAIATAAATCPDCGRTGTVPVSTEVVVHKTILCTDCADLKVAAATRADSASGEQASEGREVAVSHVGASQGQETPNSHLATEGDLDALAPEDERCIFVEPGEKYEWADDNKGPQKVTGPAKVHPDGRVERWDALAPASPMGEIALLRWFLSRTDVQSRWPCLQCGREGPDAPLRSIDCTLEDGRQIITGCWLCTTEDIRDEVKRTLAAPLACRDCGDCPEVILLLPDRPQKCINCLLIAAMKRPCSICGQHITEAITRALDQQGKPNTIGVCAQCFMKAVAAQRN